MLIHHNYPSVWLVPLELHRLHYYRVQLRSVRLCVFPRATALTGVDVCLRTQVLSISLQTVSYSITFSLHHWDCSVCQVNNGLDHLSEAQKHISGIEIVSSFIQGRLEEAIWRENGEWMNQKKAWDLCLNTQEMSGLMTDVVCITI